LAAAAAARGGEGGGSVAASPLAMLASLTVPPTAGLPGFSHWCGVRKRMCAHGKPPLVTTDREPLGLYRDAQTTDALRGLRFRLVGDSTMMELAMALSHVGVACDRIEWHALCVVDHRPSMLLRLLADALRGAPDVLVISVGMWYSWNTSSAAGAPTEGSTSTDAKHIHRRGCNAVRLAAASFSPPKTRSPPIQPPPPSTRWTARQPARTSTAASSTPRARRTPTIGVHAVPSAGHTTLTICTASSAAAQLPPPSRLAAAAGLESAASAALRDGSHSAHPLHFRCMWAAGTLRRPAASSIGEAACT